MAAAAAHAKGGDGDGDGDGGAGSDACNSLHRRVDPPASGGVLSWIAVLIWLGAIHFNTIVGLVVLANLRRAWAIAVMGLYLLLMVLPAHHESPLGRKVATFICKYAPKHFPIRLHVDDIKSFDLSKAYVFAVEPHSILPIGIISLCHYTGYMPFTKIRALASSAVFATPILRHIWTWLGLVPASRKTFGKLLNDGYSCIVVPGGVQECLYMEHGHEVVFLKKRFGFVRVAIETGAPLVPVFCFGQTEAYKWWKPKGELYAKLSRAIGFTPLVFWGMYGSPVPCQQEMYVAVGNPIEVTKTSQPSREEVANVLEKFIVALQELFEKHKAAAGYKDTMLHVY
ncbi:hypothetical protein SELMODRAFT_96204 [Selaginella moellendorffii]|uniref:Acyltransferase n=2 Tax=Selaginella moellendorffii TaxID=88036 RepID=D8RLS1_SELML|nr:hypothetical protein SELMODRAFT_172922 [Selaginella moellendorffii]EFJ26971.1 hypothetical protein SELMODRAFT_96204 [Selaginella moellendorffii]